MEPKTANDLIALKIVHYLITPINQWDAYQHKIIDKDGNQINPVTQSTINYYGMFEKLMIRLRKYLSTSVSYPKSIYPSNAGQEFFGQNLAGAAVSKWSPSNKIFLPGQYPELMKENAGCTTASVGGVGPTDTPKPITKIIKRKLPKFKEYVKSIPTSN
jgi:hypothetical protein